MSQVGAVRKVVCAWISVFLQSERWRCHYWSAYVAAAVTWLRYEGCKMWETRAEGCRVKWRGLCRSNVVIHIHLVPRLITGVTVLLLPLFRICFLCLLRDKFTFTFVVLMKCAVPCHINVYFYIIFCSHLHISLPKYFPKFPICNIFSSLLQSHVSTSFICLAKQISIFHLPVSKQIKNIRLTAAVHKHRRQQLLFPFLLQFPLISKPLLSTKLPLLYFSFLIHTTFDTF